MTQTFGDVATAAKVRDLMSTIATDVVNNLRPAPNYGTTVSVDPENKVAVVRFQNDPGTVSVKLGSLVPSGPGQLVRIGGVPGDRFLEDVLGPSSTQGTPSGSLVAVTGLAVAAGLTSFTITWTLESTAASYEVQVATDTLFASVVQDVKVTGSTATITGLLPSSTYYVRVRPLNTAGLPGPWCGTVSAAVQANPVTPLSDGAAPSTAPVVSPIGGPSFIELSWPAVPNPDPVTYVVYMSTSSGFTPGPSNLVGTTASTFAFVHKDAAGAVLAYSTIYYFIVVATDRDGAGPASIQVSCSPVKITTTDIQPGSITTPLLLAGTIAADVLVAGSITADLIQANSLTSAQIASNAITADELASINVTVGKVIQSQSYVAGQSGWTINGDGSAEFNNMTVRGSLIAGFSTTAQVPIVAITSAGGLQIATIADNVLPGFDASSIKFVNSTYGARATISVTDTYGDLYCQTNGNIYFSAGGGNGAVVVGGTFEVGGPLYGRSNAVFNGSVVMSNWSSQLGNITDGTSYDFGGFNPYIRLGQTTIKGLNSGTALQARNGSDTGYVAMQASAFTVSSSIKFKDNVVEFSDNALDHINAAKVREFDWKDSGSHEMGLILEELPELIHAGDAKDSYSLAGAIGLLWKAVQELDARTKV